MLCGGLLPAETIDHSDEIEAVKKNWLRPQEKQRELSHFRLRFSQKKRKLIEQGFGWAKTVGQIRQVMVHGLQRVHQMFVLTMAAHNLTRLRASGQIRLQTL